MLNNIIIVQEYVSLRLLSDETAATSAARYLKDHASTTLALVTDQSRAEFGYGLQVSMSVSLDIIVYE